MAKDYITRQWLAARIDHALLSPAATNAELVSACELSSARKVCCLVVRPCDVAEARRRLDGAVALGTVVGFPHGATTTEAKVAEACRAIDDGADELDMVLNIGRLRDGLRDWVRDDIAAVVTAGGGQAVKVIFECCYLDRDQMANACWAAVQAGASFVKTSTGFGPSGASVEDVRFLSSQVSGSMGVKAAGGIRTLADAVAMIEAGATRIGTSSTEAILAEL